MIFASGGGGEGLVLSGLLLSGNELFIMDGGDDAKHAVLRDDR